MQTIECTSCGRPISADPTVLDGDRYCRGCVERAGLTAFDPAIDLHEEVRFTVGAALLRAVWTWVYTTAAVDLVLTVLVMMIGVGGILLEGPGGRPFAAIIAGLVRGLSLFAAGAWLFISVFSLPVSLVMCLAGLRRTISVSDRHFHHETRWKRHCVPLSECSWHLTSMASDQYGTYLPGNPLVIVRAGQLYFGCGFNPRAREIWPAVFRLKGVHERRVLSVARRLALAALGVICGASVGAALGFLAATATANDKWLMVSLFLGAIDGLICAWLVCVLAANESAEWLAAHCRPILVAALATALGAKVGVFFGRAQWPNIVICALANGCVGFVAGCVIARRVRVL